MSSTHDGSPDRSTDFSDVKKEGGKALKNASDSAVKMVDAAKTTASDFAGNAAESFKSAVETQKTSGAAAVGDVARAAKGAADRFQESAP